MRYTHAQLSSLVDQGFHTAALRGLELPPLDSGLPGQVEYLQAVALRGRGELIRAREILQSLLPGEGSLGGEVFFNLLEIDLLLGRQQEVLKQLEKHPHHHATYRGTLLRGRAYAQSAPHDALGLLLTLADGADVPVHLARLASFEAAALLDRAGRHREAFTRAAEAHARSAVRHGHLQFLHHLDTQAQFLRRQIPPRDVGPAVERTALVVGLPRSGTTLLEQMLDAHPEVYGIGEFDGLKEVLQTLVSQRVSPYQFADLPPGPVANFRRLYREGARRWVPAGNPWTLDKSLLTWCSIPFVAEFLPGARLLHLRRDPRDLAISILLSGFPAGEFPWAGRLEDLYEVLRRVESLVPEALDASSLRHETSRYEDLVSDPRSVMERCSALLGLTVDPRTLDPGKNPRPVNTLSYNQVRQPIYRASVGRWKNYGWLFNSAWHRLAAEAGYE